MPANPFQIEPFGARPSARAATVLARPFLTWLLQLRTFERLYADAQTRPPAPFAHRALEALNIRAQVSRDQEVLIPSEGPLIIACNHLHGALDGLLLASLIRRRRPDVRVLTNFLLSRIPELTELCLFVDPFGGRSAQVRNQAGLRASHLWLRNGGALIVFPAGEVAHTRATAGTRRDSPWSSTVGRLALATGARVLPAFIEGKIRRCFMPPGISIPHYARPCSLESS